MDKIQNQKYLNFMELLTKFRINSDIRELVETFKGAANLLSMDRIILYKVNDLNTSTVSVIYSNVQNESFYIDMDVENNSNINLINAIKTKSISTEPVEDIGEDIAIPILNNQYVITGDDIDEARETNEVDHILFNLLAQETDKILDLHFKKMKILDDIKVKETLMIKAFTDYMTGSLNKAARDQHIDENKDIYGDDFLKVPKAILMLDIDFFKKFNDSHGHDAGDRVLIEVFKILEETVKDNAMVYRVGGEEITIVITDGKPLEIAEKCRKAVEDLEIIFEDKILKVTISIGLSNHLNPKEAIKDADKALYYSKDHGRNKVTVATNDVIAWFKEKSAKDNENKK